MAALGWMPDAAMSQPVASAVIPTPAIARDLRPSPYAVSVYKATKSPIHPGPSE
jgi:hypothetical protein